MRRCAVCGTTTKARKCPDDGFPTLRVVDGTGKEIQPGAELAGRYVVTDLIGQGGFGKVYGLQDRRTGMSMAVKVLSPVFNADSEEATRRFVREAATTAGLTHGNTIRVFDYGQTRNGQLFLVMERLQGEPLSARIRRHITTGKPMASADIVSIGAGVLSSLVEAHERGLVHRDMKPENVFMHQLGRHGIVKVLDFGIVRQAGSEMTQAGQPIGTPSHMSPEQAMGRDIDPRSDLYSLGMVLYECAALRLPYPPAANSLMVMMQHVTATPTPLAEAAPQLEPELAAVIDRALARDLDERWQTAAEMREALRACKIKGARRRRTGQTQVKGDSGRTTGLGARPQSSHALLAERRATRIKLGKLPDDPSFARPQSAPPPPSEAPVKPRAKRIHNATTQRLSKKDVLAQIDEARAAAAKSKKP